MIKNHIDLTSETANQVIFDAANKILETSYTINAIYELETKYSTDRGALSYNVAIKIAKSKYLIERITQKVTVTVVFALYKEQNRIQDKSIHPNGENFIKNKIRQLNWLFENVKDLVKWKMILVDDGCPNNSGRIAQEIIKKHFSHYDIEVLFLQNAIDRKLPTAKYLSNTDESQKGGAILYGMWKAAQDNHNKNHIIIYTDADLSIHLSQIGLLIYDIVKCGVKVAIGSKREKYSILMKSPGRNLRGMFFISLWKQLIPDIAYLNDTQCPLKAYRADLVYEIIEGIDESKFAFDIELLLKAHLHERGENKQVIKSEAIAVIDNEAESTTIALNPYLGMLKSVVKMYRRYLPPKKKSDTIADFINALSEKEWNILLEKIPKENIGKNVNDFKFDFLNTK